jgi:hypothetical protein
MVQVTRLTACSFIFLMTFIGASGAAEQQFSCKGQVIQEMPKPTGQPPSPIDLTVTPGSNGKMSLKIGDGKSFAAHVTSDNKIQLKFKSSQFVGEYFYYSGDLFLIYNSGQLARMACTRS